MPSSTIYAVLLALVMGVGCGEKAPELRSEKVITPGEAANKLFVESTKQMAEAVSKEKNDDIDGAIAGYEQVVSKVRKIVNDYPESDIAVKLVSGEALFTGNTLQDIERRAGELRRVEEQRKAEMRLAEEQLTRKRQEGIATIAASKVERPYESIKDPIERAIRRELFKPTGELTKADLEKVTRLSFGFYKLTDVKGLEKLTQLMYLSLRDNPDLTKAQIDELQKALPKCKIYSDFP